MQYQGDIYEDVDGDIACGWGVCVKAHKQDLESSYEGMFFNNKPEGMGKGHLITSV